VAEFIVGNPLRKIAREHDTLRHLLWRVDFALVWLLHKLLKILPIDLSSRAGDRLGRWIGPRLRSKSAIYRENLAIAFPELGEEQLDELLVQAWGRAGRILAEYAHLETILRDPQRLQIDIRQPDGADEYPSRPCVVATAHLSNWEVVCTAMARLGMPNVSLYTPPTNPLLDRLLSDSRRALGCELLPRDNSARSLVRALKQGRTAGFVMDRRIDNGKQVTFFGHDKSSTTMPAKLALKFGCDLVPTQVQRLGDARFRIIFHPPVRPSRTDVDEATQALDMTQQLHELFERWIRQQPRDWFCSKRLWPKGKMEQLKEAAAHDGVETHAS
jgi:KDO2-lipid IV(A) lauroyltransferase